MISKIEIIIILTIFISIYTILYMDHKLHEKCKCKNCYLSSNNISLKIPLLFTIIGFVIYKFIKPYLQNNTQIIKQNIITDMADF